MSETVQKEQKSVNISSWKIFLGFIIGAVLGLVFNQLKTSSALELWLTGLFNTLPFMELSSGWLPSLIKSIVNNLFYPVGNAFLQSLFMIIVPLVFSSLIVGVSDLGSGKHLGRLSKRLFLFYALTTLLAISIGQIFINTFEPGKSVEQETAKQVAQNMRGKLSALEEKSSLVGTSLWPGIVTKIIPRNIIDQFGENNMLAVIFVSLLFGVALLSLPKSSSRDSFIQIMSAVSNMSITIIGWIMKIAPFAVAALLTIAVSEFGLDLIKSMGFYVLLMLAGMFCHLVISYSCILKFITRAPLKEFLFKILPRFVVKMIPVFTTAFGTSSSSATMPVTMNTLEKKFGIPRSIVNFSVPIGTIVNMDGTALFEVVATVFIAQIFGVDLTFINHITLIAIVFITSVGIAGVPGGSLPILMAAIVTLGIPAEGIAIILGVDRLLDMGRTTVNVTGDSIAALFLGRTEGIDVAEKIKKIPS